MAAPNPRDLSEILERAAAGDTAGWGELLGRYHDRLRRVVALRMDPQLRGRVDPSDILQETYLQALAKLPDYLHAPAQPFYLWLRLLTGHRIGRAHREHLGAQMRATGREVSLDAPVMPGASSAALAARLAGREAGPSEAARRAERRRLIRDALDRLSAEDREAIALRNFEQLSWAEAARVLGISEEAAGKRYLRAVERLKRELARLPGGLDEFPPA